MLSLIEIVGLMHALKNVYIYRKLRFLFTNDREIHKTSISWNMY